MRKILLIAIVMVLACQLAQPSVCVSEVDDNNNGSCELELQYNAGTNSWELTAARCIIFRKNIYGQYECKVLFIPVPDPDPDRPELHPA